MALVSLVRFTQENGFRCDINRAHVVAVEESDTEGITIIVTSAHSVFSNYRVECGYDTVVACLEGRV